MRLIFWGSPEFALPSLRALLGEGHDVAAVVTQPDRPAGRGRELRPTVVKHVAEEEGLPVLQPERPRGDAFLEQLASFEPELFVVVAYGQILPREVLELPPRGSINLHASLLPELRGAAPIQWAIARGHERTGVTVMRMVERMDAGPILHQVAEPILPEETAAELAARLSEIGAEALVETLVWLESGRIEPREQDESLVTFAPRIRHIDARIDWAGDADSAARLIRAMDDVPGAWTRWRDTEVKMYRPLPEPDAPVAAPPGTILEADALDPAAGVRVACGRGAVRVREVKPAGRRRMLASEWVRGRGPAAGDRFD